MPSEARKERGDFGAFSAEGVLLDLKPFTSSFFGTFVRVCNGVALVTLAAVLVCASASFVNCVPLLTGTGGASSSDLLPLLHLEVC